MTAKIIGQLSTATYFKLRSSSYSSPVLLCYVLIINTIYAHIWMELLIIRNNIANVQFIKVCRTFIARCSGIAIITQTFYPTIRLLVGTLFISSDRDVTFGVSFLPS
jgi:hypothetical protein